MKNVSHTLRINRHFSLPYTTGSNGTIEFVFRGVVKVTRTVLFELHLSFRAWDSVLSIMQIVMNISTSRILVNHYPLTVFTGLPQDSPFTAVLQEEDPESVSMTDKRAPQIMSMYGLRKALDQMHRDSATLSSKKRIEAIDSPTGKTGLWPIYFGIGKYVLRVSLEINEGPKRSSRWKFLLRVVGNRD